MAPKEVRLLTVGKPLDGHKIKIVDEDEKELARGEVGELWLAERLEIIDQLPVVGDQKIDKKSLRDQIAKKLEAEGKV